MPPLLSVSLTPLYAQVLITASPEADVPQWKSGEEPAIATHDAIAIGTIPDQDAHGAHQVSCEVWLNERPASEAWTQLVTTRLSITAWGLAVSDVLRSRVFRAKPIPGEYLVAVFGRPAAAPSELQVALTLQPVS